MAPPVRCENCRHASSCVEHFDDVLRAHEGRLSDARRSLLVSICERRGHFLPEELARLASEHGTPVSVTTVYRNLPLLLEAGIVRKTSFTVDGAVRYEPMWKQEEHDHLVCSRCGTVVEFAERGMRVLEAAVADEHGFRLQNHRLEIVGVCAECRHATAGQA